MGFNKLSLSTPASTDNKQEVTGLFMIEYYGKFNSGSHTYFIKY
jgi:hypothetical protein